MDPSSAYGLSKMDRKRKPQEINRLLRTLANMLPGSKDEFDEVYILDKTIKHVKHLEGRLNNNTVDEDEHSAVLSGETKPDNDSDPSNLPWIRVRTSQREAAVTILCENHEIMVSAIRNEVEKLHLSVIRYSTMSFGRTQIVISILAKIDEGFFMNTKDLRDDIHLALLKLMEINKLPLLVS